MKAGRGAEDSLARASRDPKINAWCWHSRYALERILHQHGFGTRKECRGLVRHERVTIGGRICEDPRVDIDIDGLVFTVDGIDWHYAETATLVLHKPAGYECSRQPQHHPGILELLPRPLRDRGVQPIGRLDQDTTGLLLLSDDGQLNHALSSGKRKVPKPTSSRPGMCRSVRVEHLLAESHFLGEPQLTVAAVCGIVGEYQLRLTVTEGKYHQVKRMVAAAGNRVEGLHREAIGGFALPPELEPGEWRWLCASERQQLGVSV
ncbi:MAG: 16S rRNA pseudouridine(516) synthase [Gammaproteobacteria bacterium]|nr:16S rRNA pseudouridine(516) synthase [Gammaproteobacteria bacterium]